MVSHNPDFLCKCAPKFACDKCVAVHPPGWCSRCNRKTYSRPDLCERCIEREVVTKNAGPKRRAYCFVCHSMAQRLKRCRNCSSRTGLKVNLDCLTCRGMRPPCTECHAKGERSPRLDVQVALQRDKWILAHRNPAHTDQRDIFKRLFTHYDIQYTTREQRKKWKRIKS